MRCLTSESLIESSAGGLRSSALPNPHGAVEAQALRRRQSNSSSVSNALLFSAVVKRQNKPQDARASKGP